MSRDGVFDNKVTFGSTSQPLTLHLQSELTLSLMMTSKHKPFVLHQM